MPWPDRLPAALRRLYRAGAPEEHVLSDMSVPPPSLEQDLMARFARRHPAPARPRLAGFVRGYRWALSTGLAAVAVAAACRMPYDYDRGFGATVWCEAIGEDVPTSDRLRALADRLEQRAAAEQVTMRVHADHGSAATVRIDLWGGDAARIDDELLAEVEDMPELKVESCRIEPLVETVHGTLGGRLGFEWFDLELLDQDDAEAARAQILERLEARGLRGDAEVEISDDGAGRREIKIRIEAEGELPDDGAARSELELRIGSESERTGP
ncbi:hypothetical protein [Nannocystis punicea]|uniref:DUF4179 domain-containing protein n=1 Tax=Nannocystis punicea TaxID=2995304 RepID=A0ABY7HBE0_9BACT|nr:hypothetical protein [Nannocystis poenicansa]WAS96339.1 hypothetical protein O0S08_09280 [Nannocystis poenicansa]